MFFFSSGGCSFKGPAYNAHGELTATSIIQSLRHVFSGFGLPEHIVTDKGSQFTNTEFQEFLGTGDMKHTLTAPWNAATNDLENVMLVMFRKKK